MYRLQELPPKTHNLIYLLDKIGVRPAEQMGKFIVRLSEANIATRYPEDLERLQAHFTPSLTAVIVEQTEDILEWIKKQFYTFHD
jgi:HEPN domain-containing protein